MTRVTLFTDGSYKEEKKMGGYAGVMVAGKHSQVIYGNVKEKATNNRMEIQAVVRTVSQLNQPCLVHLVSDSQYVLNGIDKWMDDWKENGWKNSKGAPVENQDLWKKLDVELSKHKVTTQWVKGHQRKRSFTVKGNNLADYFAQAAAREKV